MKKNLLLAFAFCCSLWQLNAQTSKQAANAMRASNPAHIQIQTTQQRNASGMLATQSLSGFYQEGFESTTFPPTGWRQESVMGAKVWSRSTAQKKSGVASANIAYETSGGLDWLITPKFQVTATTDSMVFWLRLAFNGYPPDSLAIKVSTTDSLTTSFTKTLLLLREGVNYPPGATAWYRFGVSLSAYVGQNVFLAFKHYNVDGDGLYIDDVKIGTPPANEINATALLAPGSNVAGGNIVPMATFLNNGSATQTFSVTTQITPGGYSSTSTISSLAPGASATATFSTWNAVAGTYTVKAFSQLPGDVNMTNDTITRVVTILGNFTNYGWENMSSLPAGRWATGPVFAKPCISNTDTGFVYLISGGDASFANSNLNTRFNTVTGTYSNMAVIPQARTQVTPVYVNGKIYVVGGYSGSFSPVNTNSIYDIATNTWTTGAVMPQASGDYAVGTYKDSLIYYIGGYSGTTDLNNVQIYNTFTDTWTTGTVKPGTAVAGGRLGISGTKIVFVGGYSQTLSSGVSTSYLGDINPASPATITWTSISAYPGGNSSRLGAGVLPENNNKVYFGGGDPDGAGTSTLNSVFAYNTLLNQWEAGPNLPVGVSNISELTGAFYNDSLYIVTMGGYNGTSVVTQNAWLNIGPATPKPSAGNDLITCIDQVPVTLQANNGTSYTWSPAASLNNAGVSSPAASPTVTTTYTVVMGRLYGCAVTDSVKVTVNNLPMVSASGSTNTVCFGQTVTLSGSGATSYTWTNGVTDNVAYTPTATADYTVTGTDNNGCKNTAVVSVTVNTLPSVTATTSATAICNGNTVTLNGGGALTYTWTNGVTDNTAFTPTATADYTVTGTDNNGCENSAAVSVTVNALPSVTANTSATAICNGNTVTLNGGGALTYTWTNGVTDNTAFTPTATADYTVTGTDNNGCENSAVVSVTVNTLPNVTLTLGQNLLCINSGSVTLSGESPAGGSWSGTGVSGNTFDPATAGIGTYTITYTYTDGNNCSGSADDVMTVDGCVGLNNPEATHFTIYPNPATDVLTITLSHQSIAPVKAELINQLGQVVLSAEIVSDRNTMDIKSVDSGIYQLRLSDGKHQSIKRVVKH